MPSIRSVDKHDLCRQRQRKGRQCLDGKWPPESVPIVQTDPSVNFALWWL